MRTTFLASILILICFVNSFEFKTIEQAQLLLDEYIADLESFVNFRNITPTEIGNKYIADNYEAYEGDTFINGKAKYIELISGVTATINSFNGQVTVKQIGEKTISYSLVEIFNFVDGRSLLVHGNIAAVYNNDAKVVRKITFSNSGSFQNLYSMADEIRNKQKQDL